ncbi:SAM-dependent methyltransferase [Actinoplanes campanulatus]|uniref:SAM-dependent methyltransferase n=1 Tax=Actinoplanes campanulatus TaxID=113559 RepID=A0A7W5FEU6_9ACTN|nr:class I SAM-dependent methyltransferase [Actinoplanes campanulatus]MBB3095829.1 SAM-dependent methyltransferase [Actinoplanes campanulatus]GGN11885.1 methyltransferase [Actinoplanes campanulatus]GID37076.1 methyltransferase [Actinoplanes campanulatus]
MRAAYSFDNDDPAAELRHDLLAEILDPFTFDRLGALGDLTGLRCLEAGAGGGSVARWLAERGGRVLATDLNPRHVPDNQGYAVRRHDLTSEPVPEPPWDLIHARLVLAHLHDQNRILVRLADALAPGGILVVEDWLSAYPDVVLAAPDAAAAELVERYHRILVNQLLPANGADPAWAGRAHAAMLAAGFGEVTTEIRAGSWAGGTAGARLIAVNVAQVGDGLRAAGMTEAELERLCRLADDPTLVVRSHFTYSTMGRRR